MLKTVRMATKAERAEYETTQLRELRAEIYAVLHEARAEVEAMGDSPIAAVRAEAARVSAELQRLITSDMAADHHWLWTRE